MKLLKLLVILKIKKFNKKVLGNKRDVMSKYKPLIYLIGEGYLGSSIKNILVQQGFSVISHQKGFAIDKELLDKIPGMKIIIYLASPNKKEDLINSPRKIYEKILMELYPFLWEENYQIIYGNSDILFYPEYHDIQPDYQKNFIELNKYFQLLEKNSVQSKKNELIPFNFWNIYIPYIYSDDLVDKKPESFYSRVKRNELNENFLSEEILNQDISIQSLENFTLEFLIKLRELIYYRRFQGRDRFTAGRFEFIKIKLGTFLELIQKGTF